MPEYSESLLKINEFFTNYNYTCTFKYYFFHVCFVGWFGFCCSFGFVLFSLLLLFVFCFVSWFLCVGLAILELAL